MMGRGFARVGVVRPRALAVIELLRLRDVGYAIGRALPPLRLR